MAATLPPPPPTQLREPETTQAMQPAVIPLVFEPLAQPVQPRNPATMQTPQTLLSQPALARDPALRVPAFANEPAAMRCVTTRAQSLEQTPPPLPFDQSPAIAPQSRPLTRLPNTVEATASVAFADPQSAALACTRPFMSAAPRAATITPYAPPLEAAPAAPPLALEPSMTATPETAIAMAAARPEASTAVPTSTDAERAEAAIDVDLSDPDGVDSARIGSAGSRQGKNPAALRLLVIDVTAFGH